MADHKEGTLLTGRYELVKKLGEGNYGVVWKAEDKQLQKPVAIKTLHKTRARIKDLQNEAVAQARLDSPNIADIYSVDIDDRYIAMEYIEGESLESFLKIKIAEGAWVNFEEATNIFIKSVEALVCAHKNSVVHGDIKPGNIMISKDGHIKVTDFGVAKIIASEESEAPYEMASVRRLGSMTYMAPEILKGGPRNFQSDIFSLGMVGYLLYTKHHPFYNPHPSGLFTVRDMLLASDEPKEANVIEPELPELYNRVINKMIARRLEDRYQNIGEVYGDLIGLGLLCPDCSFKNALEANFCSRCGHSLKDTRDDQYRGKSIEELQRTAFYLNGIDGFDEAFKICSLILKTNPDYGPAYHTRGFALSGLGRFEDARADFNKCLTLATDDVEKGQLHRRLAYTYHRQHDYKTMMKEIKLALEINPFDNKAQDLYDKFSDWDKDIEG